MSSDVRYIIALSQVNSVGPVMMRSLVSAFGSAEGVVRASRSDLNSVQGLRPEAAETITSKVFDEYLAKADYELEFAARHGIDVLPFTSPRYPQRLSQCSSAPATLFLKGDVNLNSVHMLSVVGTRQPSEEGKRLTYEIVSELGRRYADMVVVSGLAYGVDVAAHRAALEAGVATIGVVAHGLDQIYPSRHRDVAAQMVQNGGILTEYFTGTRPDAPNFVARNRIVAGLSDATLVVESGAKGGSLITANLAFDFSRDVYAIPGRPADQMSAGCNALIAKNIAQLVCDADDIEKNLGWSQQPQPIQGDLFSSVEEPVSESATGHNMIYEALMPNKQMTAAQLSTAIGQSISEVSASLLLMELEGQVRLLPDGTYVLNK